MFGFMYLGHDRYISAMTRLREEQLFQAVIRNDLVNVRHWISQGADANKAGSDGRTSLGAAAYIGDTNILKALLDSNKNQHLSSLKQNRYKKRTKRDIQASTDYKIKLKSSVSYTTLKNSNKFMRPSCKLHENRYSSLTCEDYSCEVFRDCGINRGYFVVVHSDDNQPGSSEPNDQPVIVCTCSPTTSSSSSSTTPTSSDTNYDLEWDEEVRADQPLLLTYEDEHWTSLYKWYATILEKTGAVLANAAKEITGPDQQDVFQRTAMHYAADQGHLEAVKILVDAGCRPDVCASDGLTPMHLAVTRDNIAIVEVLLKANALINRTTVDKNTVLHIAASRGYCNMVDLLCKSNAAIEARDLVERSALMVAASRGCTRTASILIAAGANVNAEEIHGYTPLCEAVWQRNTELVALLLKSGARVTHSHRLIHFATSHREYDIVQLLCAAGGVNLYNDNGDTPLIVSAKVCHPQIALTLLKHGANPNKCNSITGVSALHEIVELNNPINDIEDYLKVLLEFGVDLDVTALAGDTPLNRAVLMDKGPIIRLLVKHGADVNICDIESCALDNLTVISRRHNLPLTKLLLRAGHVRPPPLEIHKEKNVYELSINPLSLLEIASIQVRKSIRSPIYKNVKQLPIPVCLQLFLMFED